ncbi:MAG TPA: FtsX-like permease family protein [Frankiaceae bacterium]|nr:FtsX-like permease family protein [Frankiaceae bacterium]
MYPELTLPLLAGTAVAVAVLLWVTLRYAFLRRLAGRQLRRRRTEALLVIAGSLLGTTMVVASLVVGDTLDHSVRAVAYRTLGPVDERVTSLDPKVGAEVARRLGGLGRGDGVDGVLTVTMTPAAALRQSAAGDRAEPRTLLFEADFAAAASFGGAGSGLSGPAPGPGEVVVNDELADTLGLRAGDEVTLYPFAVPVPLRVVRVVPTEGLAGAGPGEVNRDAFVPAGTLAAAARTAGRGAPTWLTLVSNTGGVEAGAALSDAVATRIEDALSGVTGASVDKPKQRVLRNAEETGAVLGSVFLFISSFSIIAGVLLLVNVFVMLAEERKAEIGMLRAIGLRRGRLVGALVAEGSVYAAVAAVLGVGAGVVVGRGVVEVAARVFRSFGEGALADVTFAVRPVSLVNGAAAGFLIAFVTVAAASARISRTNVIAAIRDLPGDGLRRMRRRTQVLCALGAALFTAAAVPAVASSNGPTTYALPAVALLCAVPLLARRLPRRAVYNGAALLVLLWALLANIVRPDVFDDPTTTTYTVLGAMLSFAAVVLVSENQHVVLRPLQRLVSRPSEAGLATRLAVAYPTAKRFRTGATLAMYSLVIFTLVLITEITSIMNAGVDGAIRDSAGRYAVRADFAVPPADGDPGAAVRASAVGASVTDATPLRAVTATSDDPGGRWAWPVPVVVVGVSPALAADALPFESRQDRFASDAAVWAALATDPSLVVVDTGFGATGGPLADAFGPGDVVTVTDPRTGRAVPRTIAGVLRNGLAFMQMTADWSYPVLMAEDAVRAQFGGAATPSSVLLALRSGEDPEVFATRLQAALIASGVRATGIEHAVRQSFAANTNFFRLMQGFLALGLVVGITGLGVVMVRAVRERRRTIGVLRALGFRARTIRRSFLTESALVATEGIVSGAVLAVVTSWLLFTNSPAFGSLTGSFPIAWLQIAGIVVVTFGASMLATLAPANRAAGILPARALRISD